MAPLQSLRAPPQAVTCNPWAKALERGRATAVADPKEQDDSARSARSTPNGPTMIAVLTARAPASTERLVQPGAAGPAASSDTRRGRAPTEMRIRLRHVPGPSSWRPRTHSSRHVSFASEARRTRTSLKWSAPNDATPGSGCHVSDPEGPTRITVAMIELRPGKGPRLATVAPTDRMVAEQPGPIATRTTSRSPPIGWAAVPTIQTPQAVGRKANAPDERISSTTGLRPVAAAARNFNEAEEPFPGPHGEAIIRPSSLRPSHARCRPRRRS